MNTGNPETPEEYRMHNMKLWNHAIVMFAKGLLTNIEYIEMRSLFYRHLQEINLNEK